MPESCSQMGFVARAQQRLEYVGAAALLTVLRYLPLPLALAAAELAGHACGLVVPKWRAVADQNLRRALPELDASARQIIRRGVYSNLGRVALALAKLPAWSAGEIRKHVEFVGLEHFHSAAAKGHGVMLLTAHLGNWELGALAHGAVVGPISVIVRPISNRLVDSLVESRRRAHGNRVINKQKSAREVLKVLAANGTVGILADQNALGDEAVFVDFFGMPAATNKGFAQLALHSGAAVVPAVARWNASSKRHVIEYGPEIPLTRTDISANDVVSNTQRFQRALEDSIRKVPEQWLWIHRRWKAQRPQDSPSTSAKG